MIYQVANREWKLWGRGGKQAAGEYGLFRNKNLAFYANGYVNENQGGGKTIVTTILLTEQMIAYLRKRLSKLALKCHVGFIISLMQPSV